MKVYPCDLRDLCNNWFHVPLSFYFMSVWHWHWNCFSSSFSGTCVKDNGCNKRGNNSNNIDRSAVKGLRVCKGSIKTCCCDKKRPLFHEVTMFNPLSTFLVTALVPAICLFSFTREQEGQNIFEAAFQGNLKPSKYYRSFFACTVRCVTRLFYERVLRVGVYLLQNILTFVCWLTL